MTLEAFREGIYHVACEDQLEADRLFEHFKERVLEEVVKTSNAKKAGKSPAEIIFERMKRNEAARHREQLRSNVLEDERIRGVTTPKDTDCHHIVSFNHPGAIEARSILNQYGIDIDSHHNGVRLPSSSKHVPHKDMPNAYNHKSIHTTVYYTNITNLLDTVTLDPDVSKDDIIGMLKRIAQQLVEGVFPIKDEK